MYDNSNQTLQFLDGFYFYTILYKQIQQDVKLAQLPLLEQKRGTGESEVQCCSTTDLEGKFHNDQFFCPAVYLPNKVYFLLCIESCDHYIQSAK